jgi:hypothetical protein
LAAVLTLAASSLRAASGPVVELNLERATPRAVEEQTARAIVRDYGAAWTALDTALDENRLSALGDVWTGFAKQQAAHAIDQQRQSGVRVHYVDHGHKLDALFYSPEGSAVELRDTAVLEREILDGNKVIDSGSIVVHYLVVMTPTSDHWQIRVFQSAP